MVAPHRLPGVFGSFQRIHFQNDIHADIRIESDVLKLFQPNENIQRPDAVFESCQFSASQSLSLGTETLQDILEFTFEHFYLVLGSRNNVDFLASL